MMQKDIIMQDIDRFRAKRLGNTGEKKGKNKGAKVQQEAIKSDVDKKND